MKQEGWREMAALDEPCRHLDAGVYSSPRAGSAATALVTLEQKSREESGEFLASVQRRLVDSLRATLAGLNRSQRPSALSGS